MSILTFPITWLWKATFATQEQRGYWYRPSSYDNFEHTCCPHWIRLGPVTRTDCVRGLFKSLLVYGITAATLAYAFDWNRNSSHIHAQIVDKVSFDVRPWNQGISTFIEERDSRIYSFHQAKLITVVDWRQNGQNANGRFTRQCRAVYIDKAREISPGKYSTRPGRCYGEPDVPTSCGEWSPR